MRPFTSTISLDEARRRLHTAVRPITRTEPVALDDAVGRVAASDIVSAIDVPPFPRSAMDGYAVIAADTTGATPLAPVHLRRRERIYTGQVSSIRVSNGTCAEIATGAPMPDGADAVVMVEQTQSDGDDILILGGVTLGQHTGRRAADIAAGDLAIRSGDVMTPSRVGALAAIGLSSVVAFTRPRVAILSTGNEVVEPGHPLAPGQIYDVNRFTLGAIVRTHGGVPEPHLPANDTLPALEEALRACAGADLIVFSGGSSVGERDLIVDLIAAQGEMVFHGVAIKPGKPTAFAMVASTPFFGMPGNPTSCLSNVYVFLVPFLRQLARLPPYMPRRIRAPLARGIASSAGRHQFYTVRLLDGLAYPAFKGSGDITSLSQADGYIEIGPDQDRIEEGTEVEVTLF